MKKKEVRRLSMPFGGKPRHRSPSPPEPKADIHGPWTRHHLIPRSRRGKTTPGNLVELPEKMHRAWHYLFGNMTPEEVMFFIATYLTPAGYLDLVMIRQGRYEIRAIRQDLAAMRKQPVDRANVPGFQDAHQHHLVRAIYRHRKKRRPR